MGFGAIGPVPTADGVEDRELDPAERARAWLWARRWFLGMVVLPSLLVALYLFAYASDQYESEAHFLVRSAAGTMTPSDSSSDRTKA